MQQHVDEQKDCSTILYTGLILTEESHLRLLGALRHYIPAGWMIKAHHMTINLGALDKELNPELELGEPASIEAFAVGRNDKVVAVRVKTTLRTFNANPHVTIACNYEGGGRPRDSNDLTEFESLNEPIVLTGCVQTDE